MANAFSTSVSVSSTAVSPDWQSEVFLANFEHNCKVLRPRAPELVQQLKACPFPPSASGSNSSQNTQASTVTSPADLMAVEAASISVQLSRDGHWVLHFQNKPLYSRYRPIEECKKWIGKDLHKDTNSAIFAGFGLGYQIDEFLSCRSKALILVVESSYALFKAALCLRPLEHLLGNPKFFCSVGPAANLELYLHHFSERNFQFYQLQSLFRFQSSFYQPLQRRIFSLLSRFRINTNTLNRFGQLWVKNIAMNLSSAANAADAGFFYRRFEGLPFLLLAAGPSLESLLTILSQLRERFVLLVVDTALSVILQQGIQPDFVISVDPQLLNARHFDFCEAPNSILVSESCIYPSIFEHRWRFHALFHSSFPLMARLEGALKTVSAKSQLAQIRSGGSVATAAWDFARNCKASALYIAGLDLSYPTLRSHCLGTMSQRQSLIRGKRLQPVEHLNWRVTVSAGVERVYSWQGLTVLSDKRMNVYRNWLEESLNNISANMPAWPNYIIDGCAGRAAQITGMKLILVEQALNETKCRKQINQRLEAILKPLEALEPQGQCVLLLNGITNLLGEIRDIYHWSAELLILFCYNRRSNSQEKRLRELQNNISQSPSRNIVSFFFTDTLSQIVGRSPEQEESSQLERDRLKIYQRFYLASKFHLYWLEHARRQVLGLLEESE